ncbi:hypothetical protein AAFF_G00346540 [Aldrovandia affinis]|uniref:Ig-like domain-containing protein n=1 Tax=Aldrovandia affinis TaxID=143900 RepID=A0AAD7SJJ6_9TELE|nr:hypothetical protein AAFF_G00346540 [Aldrovandia affinis]
MYIFCCCFGAWLLAPSSASSARTLSVSLGQSVTLLCEEAANANVSIEWRFKQQEHDQRQSVVVLHDGGVSPGPGFKERVKFVRTENERNYSITLGDVEFNDGGVYECKALHTDHIFSDVRLQVLVPSQVFGVLGQSVSLPCYGNINKQIHSDELHIQWQKDRQDVYKHQNSKTTYGPGFENRVSVSLDRAPHGDLSLTIEEAGLSDQGEYRCIYNIQKENGQPSLVRLNVTALDAPTNHTLIERREKPTGELTSSASSARTLSVSLGQSVTLLCEGAANANVSIEWRFKQQEQDQRQSVVVLHDGGVSPGPGFKERVKFVRTENPRNYGITLDPVEFNDGGVYECKALRTDHIFSDVRLQVLVPSQVFGVLGQSVSLPCYGNINKQIRSDELHIQWQKDGQDVYKHQNSKTTYGPGFENRVSVSLDRAPHGDLSLTIEEAGLSDQGEYRCIYNIQKENGQPPLVRLNVTDEPVPSVIPPPDSSLSGGAVAGIVVGLLLFVPAVIKIITMIIAMRKNQRMPGWRAIFSRDAKANEENDANSRGQNMMVPNGPSVPEPRPVPETRVDVPGTEPDVPEAEPLVPDVQISVLETQPSET